jgi:ketosteroid isomerase-like protein
MKWWGRLLGIGLLVLLGWWLKERFLVTDEVRIKRQITAMAGAVEHNNLLKLSDAVASDFTDGHDLDKEKLIIGVRVFRLQYTAVFIHITDLTVHVAPGGQTGQATLVAKILTKAKDGGDTELNAERFRLSFRQTEAGWKLTRAESPQLRFD